MTSSLTIGRLSKRKVDKVIDESFWEGFQDGLGGGIVGALEYASTSGYYSYNGIRRIATQAGADEAKRLIAEALEGRERLSIRHWRYKIPASVVAECYGEARIGAEPRERG